MDACAVSQFENHIRTVSGLHVGSATRHSDAVMRNLIGEDVKEAKNFLESDHTCLHLYGKKEIRAGRKMGHVTVLKPHS
jgi:5-(carboxyamino)imidazole ribonucleotide synthase